MKWPRIDPDAVRDIEEALAHFRQRDENLEAAFAKSLRTTLSQIAATPRQFARLETNESDREVRRVVLRRYKYLVIYEMIGEVPDVLAIIHASQSPDRWLTRGDT
jgi:plasmid stabilization system protein ParE